jgi:hypothetical protein
MHVIYAQRRDLESTGWVLSIILESTQNIWFGNISVTQQNVFYTQTPSQGLDANRLSAESQNPGQ